MEKWLGATSSADGALRPLRPAPGALHRGACRAGQASCARRESATRPPAWRSCASRRWPPGRSTSSSAPSAARSMQLFKAGDTLQKAQADLLKGRGEPSAASPGGRVRAYGQRAPARQSAWPAQCRGPRADPGQARAGRRDPSGRRARQGSSGSHQGRLSGAGAPPRRSGSTHAHWRRLPNCKKPGRQPGQPARPPKEGRVGPRQARQAETQARARDGARGAGASGCAGAPATEPPKSSVGLRSNSSKPASRPRRPSRPTAMPSSRSKTTSDRFPAGHGGAASRTGPAVPADLASESPRMLRAPAVAVAVVLSPVVVLAVVMVVMAGPGHRSPTRATGQAGAEVLVYEQRQ